MKQSDPEQVPEYKAEIDRIRTMYQGSYRVNVEDRIYTWHPLNPVSIYYRQTLEKALASLFRSLDIGLSSSRVLDVGCGEGSFLRYLISLRIPAENLHGLDLMPYRISGAKATSPGRVAYLVGEGGHLPYADSTFNLVSQFTVFSSLLNDGVRRKVADEIQRVLAPEGIVLWYDLRSTRQKNTRGVPRDEIQRLFSGCKLMAIRSLHASHISFFASRSSFLCEIWDRLPVIRKTHFLAVLRKPTYHMRQLRSNGNE